MEKLRDLDRLEPEDGITLVGAVGKGSLKAGDRERDGFESVRRGAHLDLDVGFSTARQAHDGMTSADGIVRVRDDVLMGGSLSIRQAGDSKAILPECSFDLHG